MRARARKKDTSAAPAAPVAANNGPCFPQHRRIQHYQQPPTNGTSHDDDPQEHSRKAGHPLQRELLLVQEDFKPAEDSLCFPLRELQAQALRQLQDAGDLRRCLCWGEGSMA